MKFITITGIDKSGKTTLINEFMESTGHEHYVIDRSPDTFFFFNILRNRIKDCEQQDRYLDFQNKFSQFVDLAVFLYSSKKDLKERFKEHNEPKIVGNLSLLEHQNEIEKYFDNAGYSNYLKLNTSTLSVEECVEKIKEII